MKKQDPLITKAINEGIVGNEEQYLNGIDLKDTISNSKDCCDRVKESRRLILSEIRQKTLQYTKEDRELLKGDVKRIIGIDPAISNMGICFGIWNRNKRIFKVQHTLDINGHKLLRHYKYKRKIYGDRLCILFAYELLFMDLFRIFKPDYVVSEGAFINRGRPNAFEPLIQVILTLRKTYATYSGKDIGTIQPQKMKFTIEPKCKMKKELVHKKIVNWNKINLRNIKNFEFLSEHVFDAIGHAYAWCQVYLDTRISEEIKLCDWLDTKYRIFNKHLVRDMKRQQKK